MCQIFQQFSEIFLDCTNCFKHNRKFALNRVCSISLRFHRTYFLYRMIEGCICFLLLLVQMCVGDKINFAALDGNQEAVMMDCAFSVSLFLKPIVIPAFV